MDFAALLARHIGQTVTIFTTSGGESGSGFTGVLLTVNANFVRLVTQIGIAPGCALGNCCTGLRTGNVGIGRVNGGQGRPTCTGTRVGSVVDIPIARIASFVHNAI
ncbi:hypothetical protein [Clostridium sp. JNZ J1-5]